MSIRLVHRASQLAVVACVSLLASQARAQAPAPAGHDAAVGEFRQARRFIEAGDCPKALPHLEESIAYEPSIGARLSIADCVEKTDPLRAWRAIADATLLAYATGDDRLAVVEARLAELERLVPLLIISVPRDDLERAGLEVSVDGRPIDRFHLRRGVGVAPGAHVVEVRSPGKAPWSTPVTTSQPGAVTRVTATLVAQAPGAAAATATATATPPRVVTVVRSDPQASRRTVGLTLGATGIAALTAGAVFGVLALGKRGELDTACGGSRASCVARPELVAPVRDNASTLAAVSTVSFVVGGLALASGAALYLWPGATPPTSAGRVRVAPVLGAVQGMSLEGVF